MCTKSDYVPDLIWDIPNWIRNNNHISDMNIPNRIFRFGKSEIEILIWECPKSNSEQSRVWSTTVQQKFAEPNPFKEMCSLAEALDCYLKKFVSFSVIGYYQTFK
jgi:hypothetical protein